MGLTALFVGISVVIYGIQIAVFRRTEDTFFYLLQDLAFVPIQVLLVTLFIARLLTERERRALLKKLNMLIGAFYSEIGTDLLKYISGFSTALSELAPRLLVKKEWKDKDFSEAIRLVHTVNPMLDARRGDLTAMKTFLERKRDFVLILLSNPNLLEHAAFTDLLWAVLHLSEELSAREDLTALPASDYDHLTGDMKRAYTHVLAQWLEYMKHLHVSYPYLFSLAVRTNPLDVGANPVVK
jgi:hypothetical protein